MQKIKRLSVYCDIPGCAALAVFEDIEIKDFITIPDMITDQGWSWSPYSKQDLCPGCRKKKGEEMDENTERSF